MTVSKTITTGRVYLVGAGPGDPGLITVSGLKYLQSGDVVVYDRLVDHRILAQARSDAELIDVGKTPGVNVDSQYKINATLISKAREGKNVVRLKGGDPFLFGRGGEEALALANASIHFEIIPGVTSAIAAPAYAGIPLTHRGYASSVTVVTGTQEPGNSDNTIPWKQLSQIKGTIAVLMGWNKLTSIVSNLRDNGLEADTPVAIIECGTQPHQRTVVGTLTDIVQRSKEARINPPIVTVIGNVVSLRGEIRWFDNRPLFGKRVMVTRSLSQVSVLSELLSTEGAQPLEVPTIEIRPLDNYNHLDNALSTLSNYSWVLFVSTNAVDAVFDRMAKLSQDTRAFGPVKVAAIGDATTEALIRRGIFPDYVPKTSVSESIVEGLGTAGLEGSTVLLPRADIGGESLSNGLTACGAIVREVTAYRTVIPKDAHVRVAEILDQDIDIVTFTSSSTVGNLANILNGNIEQLSKVKVACIGPITAASANKVGLTVDIIARNSTIQGLVTAIKEYCSKEKTF